MAGTVAVIGGGITGLAAAYFASRRVPPPRVVLFEAEKRFGGKLRTGAIEDVAIEEGADSFLDRDDAARRLCEAVGLAGALEPPAVFGAVVWSRGRLRRLPPGLTLGMPATPTAGLKEGLVSPGGALRATADLFSSGPLRGPDVSVGAFVGRRFGRQILERLVDPLLAGTRAGDVHSMSLAAALPPIDSIARANRSLMIGLRRARRAGAAQVGPPSFLKVSGGMERLADSLRAAAPEVEWRGAERVEAIERLGDAYEVRSVREAVTADAVIVCTPAHDAAQLLAHLCPPAARELQRISYASLALVNLAYPPGAARLPEGTSGLLVPRSEGRTVSACTWYSIKWPSSRPSDGGVVVRAFAGRASGDTTVERTDDDLASVVAAELEEATGAANPRAREVVRWDRALPQYEVGHLDRVARIEAALAETARVAVAGAAYRGSGIPDCIAGAERAVERVLREGS